LEVFKDALVYERRAYMPELMRGVSLVVKRANVELTTYGVVTCQISCCGVGYCNSRHCRYLLH
jgi:hypothetical protein